MKQTTTVTREHVQIAQYYNHIMFEELTNLLSQYSVSSYHMFLFNGQMSVYPISQTAFALLSCIRPQDNDALNTIKAYEN